MPGLTVPIGGGRSLGSNTSGPGLGQSGGATIAQTAYGASGTTSSAGGGLAGWHVFTGVQIAAFAWLMFIRWSLPSGGARMRGTV